MDDKGGDEADPQDPEQDAIGEDRLPHHTKELGVAIDALLSEEDLEIADHVGEHIRQQHDPAGSHRPLLADRRSIELDQEGTASGRTERLLGGRQRS